MKHLVLGLAAWMVLGLCGFSPSVRADDPANDQKGDAAKELAAIEKDWSDAQNDFMKAYRGAKTAEERQQVLKEKRPKPAEFAGRFLRVAETHPDGPEAIKALVWVVSNARGTADAKKALPKLKDKLAAITDLNQLEQSLSGLPGFGLGDLAPEIAARAKKNLDHPKAMALLLWVCGATMYGQTPELAKLYNDTVDLLVDRFADHKELEVLADWLSRDDNPAWAEKKLRVLAAKNPAKSHVQLGLGLVLKNKDEESQPEAEKLLTAAVEEFAKLPGKNQLAEQAKRQLEDIKVRGIGKPAPDIKGTDLDGKEFKLSDYKGKVVLLDFWGFW
jgi:hypothetical protein